ncbi:ribbon-helix-helix domain-containing protein [Bradyrhizobium ottawaense]
MAARMPDDLIDALDKWAAANSVERSEAIRALLRKALKR